MNTKESIENIGTSVGKGVCGILNKFRKASDDYEDYYNNKTSKGVLDYVASAANKIGRGGAKIIAGAGRVAGEIWNSDIAKDARSGIAEAYNSLRGKYKDYLTASSERLREQAEKGEHHGFRSFANSVMNAVEAVYSKGEGLVKSAAKSVSKIGRSVKDSDEYKALKAKSDEIEKDDEERKGGIVANDERYIGSYGNRVM